MKDKKKVTPLNAAQISMMPPTPFADAYSFMRNRKGQIINDPATNEPLSKRPKREWSFDGVHQVYFDDGTMEERPGRYVIKQTRQ